MLHGVMSQNSEKPALAVLRFQRQGLGTRKTTADSRGWGWPRDEKVYGYASQAIRSMHAIAQGERPSMTLPDAFRDSARKAYS